MPLSTLVEFILAQRNPYGTLLTHQGGLQINALIPPRTTLRSEAYPREDEYAQITFRLLLDEFVVPGAFQVQVNQFGAMAYTGVLFTSSRGLYLDTFLRMTHAQPISYEIQNLTNTVQRIVIYTAHISVATEDDYKEVNRRLALYTGVPA